MGLASCLADWDGDRPLTGGQAPHWGTGPLRMGTGPSRKRPPWTAGEVIEPKALFATDHALDSAVLEANPRIYLRPARATTLVVGIPGWGGRSENFIWTLVNGVADSNRNLALCAIQDTRHGGPRYQGQGDRQHANTWYVNGHSVQVMQHFLARVTAGRRDEWLTALDDGSTATISGTGSRWRRANAAWHIRGDSLPAVVNHLPAPHHKRSPPH